MGGGGEGIDDQYRNHTSEKQDLHAVKWDKNTTEEQRDSGLPQRATPTERPHLESLDEVPVHKSVQPTVLVFNFFIPTDRRMVFKEVPKELIEQ